MGWALVTGASSGLGAEFARLAADAGYKVILAARRRDALEAVAAGLGTETRVIPIDLSEPGAGARLWAEARAIGEIDLLVNNAGYGVHAQLGEGDPARAMGPVMVNAVAVTELLLAALADWRARGVAGKALNVASLAAFMPGPGMAIYHATKSFVLSLSEAASHETRGTGITVTALCPGPARTGFFDTAEAGTSRLSRIMPLERPEMVARAGWRALERGRPVVFSSRRTALIAFASRFLPQRALAALNAFFWSSGRPPAPPR